MENEERTNFVKSNVVELCKSTEIGTELVLSLLARELINDEEKDLLLDFRTPNFRRSSLLYTETMNKWSHEQFEEFRKILKDNGYTRALQVFTERGGEYFLTNEDFEVLKTQEMKKLHGCYEGIHLKDEEAANQVVDFARNHKLIVNGKLKLDENLNRLEVITLLRDFLDNLKHRKIWWNKHKPRLLPNYIERSVCRSNVFLSDGTLPLKTNNKTITLEEITENFVLLADPPGMGKSTEVTKLEQKLRVKFPTNRIILRVNLSEVQRALLTISTGESVSSVLGKLAPFIPLEAFQVPNISLYILLDGLDEVCPKHQVNALKLLSVLMPSDTPNNIYVILTTRPQLKETIESSFKVESWSLLPLQIKEQFNYIDLQLGESYSEHNNLQETFSNSLKSLLSNPLMLSLLVEILQSEGTLPATELNTYDLYSRFVDTKHKRHLIEKERMRDEDNLTEIKVESMLTRNLPYYYHIAWDEVLRSSDVEYTIYSDFMEGLRSVACEIPPSGPIVTELVSYGVLVETANNLRFKHLSFSEFFYAKLMLQVETPQVVRDTLFSFIYKGNKVLKNVELFVAAAISSKTIKAHLHLTTKWHLLVNYDYVFFRNFQRGQLFPLLNHDLLKSVVSEDEGDFLEAFYLLMDCKAKCAIERLFKWMSENRQLSRKTVFNVPHEAATNSSKKPFLPAAACMIIAYAMMLDSQQLFTQEEVRKALQSCNRLLVIVAAIRTDTMSKWDFVEKHLEKQIFKDLILKADHVDWWRIIDDVQTVNKLWATFSREELYSLVVVEETRRSDVIGRKPLEVLMGFGKEFLNKMPQFRAKFVESQKGKTVFELDEREVWNAWDECHFAFDFLWGDLLKEFKEGKKKGGSVTMALREGIKRRSAWEVLWRLERQIIRKRKCLRDSEEHEGLMAWVLNRGYIWNQISSFPLQLLPYIILYGGNLHQAKKTIQQNRKQLAREDKSTWRLLLQSLILSTLNTNFRFFPIVHAFLQDNLQFVPSDLKTLAEVLIGATEEELKAASLIPRSPSLVADASLGNIFLGLLYNTEGGTVDTATCIDAICDVLQFTRCCDLPKNFHKFRIFSETDLPRIFLSVDLFFKCFMRLFPLDAKKSDVVCFRRSLLSFYYEVFSSDWKKEGLRLWDEVRWCLMQGFSPEAAARIEFNLQRIPPLPWFELILRLLALGVSIRNGEEFAQHVLNIMLILWRLLLLKFGENCLVSQLPTVAEILNFFAARFFRDNMPSRNSEQEKCPSMTLCGDVLLFMEVAANSAETKALFFHFAVKLGDLASAKRFACPGIVSWRNNTGKNALDVAKETFGEHHPISLFLRDQIILLTTSSFRLKQEQN